MQQPWNPLNKLQESFTKQLLQSLHQKIPTSYQGCKQAIHHHAKVESIRNPMTTPMSSLSGASTNIPRFKPSENHRQAPLRVENAPSGKFRQAPLRVANLQPPPRVTDEQWVTEEQYPNLPPTYYRYQTRYQHHANAMLNLTYRQHLEDRHLIDNLQTEMLWEQSAANDLGLLIMGLRRGNILGTRAIRYIQRNKVPLVRKVTYFN